MTNKDDSKPATTPIENTGAKTAQISPWDLLQPGAVVLSRDTRNPKEGWFECNIVSVSKDRKTLTLKWRDYPSFPQFEVKRTSVGLICVVK